MEAGRLFQGALRVAARSDDLCRHSLQSAHNVLNAASLSVAGCGKNLMSLIT